jgi:hypothetical protein
MKTREAQMLLEDDLDLDRGLDPDAEDAVSWLDGGA